MRNTNREIRDRLRLERHRVRDLLVMQFGAMLYAAALTSAWIDGHLLRSLAIGAASCFCGWVITRRG